ncbi:hypothetical protein A1O1_07560 [Capronia coronata CBS 617.96]|uniref:Haloacid dehalogenase, type II n=1 Tax=Capronia coronata CBS 617.96 TaxID=1182541 RepID=W9Y401_9EURO|nr:uncharacterized protein A1O1_07560 [Capronia coronata CBS 617.96]EXJ83931.1 hypothetical protein A1O1_07560 [Capronia coronata CBS 617.96]
MATSTSTSGPVPASSSSDLPMPEPTVPRRPFSSFKLLSFDIYGTLIDWEGGILEHLQRLTARIPADAPPHIAQYRYTGNDSDKDAKLTLAAKFNEIEASLQTERPGAKYSKILEAAYLRLAKELGIMTEGQGGGIDDSTDSARSAQIILQEAKSFGSSIGSWPAFPDTVSAMRRLAKHYKFLVPLSNVDRASFSGTLAGPLKGVNFFAVYTAEDIGSYKPDVRNFEYLFEHAQNDTEGEVRGKDDILHVAQSLFHDHIPAKKVGLSSVWINRQGAGMGSGSGLSEVHENGEVGYGWRFGSLGDFADMVEKELQGEKDD